MAQRRRLQMRLVLLSLIAALGFPHWVSADAARVIELSDGSQISGVIVDYGNGTYTIQSEALGILELRDEQIRSIHSPSQMSEQTESLNLGSPDRATLSQLEHIQNRVLAEPGVLALVMSLQQDPEVIAILNDPQIMQAIMSGQITTLQNHPKFHQLEANPTIQEIMRMLNQ